MALHHSSAVIAYRLRDYAPEEMDDGVETYAEVISEEQRLNTTILTVFDSVDGLLAGNAVYRQEGSDRRHQNAHAKH